MTNQRWIRLGELLLNRRVALGAQNLEKFAVDMELKNSRTCSDLEHGRRDNYLPSTLAHMELIYRWAPGSIKTVLAGGQPTELDDLGDQGDLIGLVIAQWYRAAPVAKRPHARDMLTDWIKRHPHGGDSGD